MCLMDALDVGYRHFDLAELSGHWKSTGRIKGLLRDLPEGLIGNYAQHFTRYIFSG